MLSIFLIIKNLIKKETVMFKVILTTILMIGSLSAFSHEGHDDTPGSLKVNHGGVVKPGKVINLEYVIKGDTVELYPASHEGSDLPLADVILTGTAKPSKGKPTPLKFESKNGAYLTKVDFKGAYRVEVQVEAQLVADNKSKKSTFKFQVER